MNISLEGGLSGFKLTSFCAHMMGPMTLVSMWNLKLSYDLGARVSNCTSRGMLFDGALQFRCSIWVSEDTCIHDDIIESESLVYKCAHSGSKVLHVKPLDMSIMTWKDTLSLHRCFRYLQRRTAPRYNCLDYHEL